MIKDIRISEYDYPLPDARIASHPLAMRDQCLLLVRGEDGTVTDSRFDSLPSLLPADSMLVYNNTRVINARLRFRKGDDGTGAMIEIFCLEPVTPADYAVSFATTDRCSWLCFVGNSKRWKEGPLTARVTVDGHDITLTATRLERRGNASVVEFAWDCPRSRSRRSSRRWARYQSPIPKPRHRAERLRGLSDRLLAHRRLGCRPTAGLHFTPRVLDEISSRGIPRRELTLHVGAGTFQPVKSDTIGEHEMHSEFIAVPRTLIEELATTDRRVIAVGTTSVRTLESLYHLGCMAAQGLDPTVLPQWYPYSPEHPSLSVAESMQALLRHFEGPVFVASTRLMIAPGYTYRIVRGMVTNFHQPRSTLLLLVSAFIGDRPGWRELYDHALAGDYRFLSYGDACLLL